MPGAAYRSLHFPSLYEDLKAKGYSKSSAAAISNARFNQLHGGHPHRKRRRRRRGA